MNILLIGSGGREHALAAKLATSPLLTKLYAAPGNPGIAQHATCVKLDTSDHRAVIDFCVRETIAFVVIGPEVPLVAGLVDDLATAGIKSFGPTRYAAQLEGSKGFTKDLCAEHNIPTADYQRFSALGPALGHVQARGAPIVVKADGLAAGKGVTVAMTVAEAVSALGDIFITPGASCVVEEFLTGEEASFFVLCDGETVLPLATAQDHKRVGDGDTGPNTGGMGAYSPAPCMTPALCEEALERIVRPTIKAMAKRGHAFKGVLYAGLILTPQGVKLIEYNARFGDPETQVLLPRMTSDLLPLLLACADGQLEKVEVKWSEKAALTVVLAAEGYPVAPIKGNVIRGLSQDFGPEVQVYQAGTKALEGDIISDGGRVLSVTALGKTLSEAQMSAYDGLSKLSLPHSFYRHDIGWRAIPTNNGQDR